MRFFSERAEYGRNIGRFFVDNGALAREGKVGKTIG
jgi:hypothetical protein